MALGFPASYETRVDFSGARQIVRKALAASFDQLGWRYETPAPDLFVAKVPMSGWSWGEKISISIEPGELHIRSACGTQIIDWGKNKSNVKQFLYVFSSKHAFYVKLDGDGVPYLDESGATPLDRVFNESMEEIERCAIRDCL